MTKKDQKHVILQTRCIPSIVNVLQPFKVLSVKVIKLLLMGYT